jgi:hypothetical protein
MKGCVARIRESDHLVSVVDAKCPALIPTERAKVAHLPTTVEEGTLGLIGIAHIRGPDHLVGVVDVAGITL